MQPHIDGTVFGSITISGEHYRHDVVIRLNGEITKRKKKLSKAIYGTSHKVSLDEARHIHEEGVERLIVGTGQSGCLGLSSAATEFLYHQGCVVELHPTPQAVNAWNKAQGAVIGMFHVTC